MVIEILVNAIFLPLNGLFSLLPDISWNVDSSVFSKIFEVLRLACYFLPMGTIDKVFALIIVITTFKIGMSIIKTIKNLLPFV